MTISRNDNLIEKAKDAKSVTEKNEIKELVLEKWYECQRTYINYTLDDEVMMNLFKEKLNQIDGSNLSIDEDKDGNKYKVMYKGEVLVKI